MDQKNKLRLLNKISLKMSSRRQYFFFVFVIAFLALFVTSLNLGWETSFAGEDYGLGYDFPQINKTLSCFSWDSFFAPGKTGTTSAISFLWTFIVYFLSKMGMGGVLLSRLMYFCFFFLSGLSFFLLFCYLAKFYRDSDSQEESSNSLKAAFVGSILYMFNPFVLYFVSFVISPLQFFYAFFPLFFYFFLRNIHERINGANFLKFIIIFLILLNTNPAHVILAFFVCFLYAFFCLFLKYRRKESFYFSLKIIPFLIFVVALLTSYVWLPNLFLGGNPYGAYDAQKDILGSLKFNSSHTSFFNLFRLLGCAAYQIIPRYQLYQQSIFLIVLQYIIVFLSIASLLISRGKRIKIFFGTLLLVFLFLAKGMHSPGGFIFRWFFLNIPFLPIFRAVYNKFVPFICLSFAVLLSFFILHCFLRIKNSLTRKYCYILCLILVLGNAIPFFSSRVVQKDLLTKIPKEYIELHQKLANDKTVFKILSLPPAPEGRGLLLRWNQYKYVGPHPDIWLLGRPILDSYWFIKENPDQYSPNDSWRGTKFESNIQEIFPQVLDMNIKYILLHKDFLDEYGFGGSDQVTRMEGSLKAKVLEKELKKNEELRIIKKNNFFNLYKVDRRVFQPCIYSMRSFHEKESAELGSLPRITFRRVNPSKYYLEIKNATEPFWLIFNESFHENWKIYFDQNSNLEKELVPSFQEYENLNVKEKEAIERFDAGDVIFLLKSPLNAEHRVIKNFANAWYIDPKAQGLGEHFNLVLCFQTQQFFYLGIIISGLVLMFLFLIIGVERIKNAYKY